MEATVTVVRGKTLEYLSVSRLWELAASHRRVIVDLGTGDGRWLYRLARQHSDWFCLGIDSDHASMREVSSRAGRKTSRGGVRNVIFLRATVETLPAGLEEFADEVHINFPWGSLLRAVVKPDPAVLARIARLGKRGAALHVRVNSSVFGDSGTFAILSPAQHSPAELFREIIPAYESAGFESVVSRIETSLVLTSWGKRLGSGRKILILALDAIVRRPGSWIA